MDNVPVTGCKTACSMCIPSISYCSVSWVDALVGLSSICVNKLSVDEQLMRHLNSHVVDILLHLRKGIL